MAWRVDSGDTLSGEPAETVGQLLYDRDEDLYEFGDTWWFTNAGVAPSAVWTTIVSTYIYMPTFVRASDVLYVEVTVINDPPGGTLRLRDVTSTDTGTEVDMTSTGQMDLTLGAWAGTQREIQIQGYKDSGTLTVGTDRMAFNVWFGSGG